MRQIINISLPQSMVNLVNKEIKKNSYASKSEFFRDLIRRWSDQQAIDEILESQRQAKNGHKYPLRSLKDLR